MPLTILYRNGSQRPVKWAYITTNTHDYMGWPQQATSLPEEEKKAHENGLTYLATFETGVLIPKEQPTPDLKKEAI